MSIFQDARIIFVLIIVCALAFGIKARELLNDFNKEDQTKELAVLDVKRLAEEGIVDPNQPLVNDLVFDGPGRPFANIEPAASSEKEEKEPDVEIPVGRPPVHEDDVDWRDASDENIEYSGIQSELFEDLAERRQGLADKERELAMREALLQAAERELDQKFNELASLRQEIEGLLQQQSDEEQARLDSLVKIYEGMKAKDAARIFNTLETDVLLSVLGRMSERKSAPILAAMNPDRARSITILLAEQKTLINLSE